ncbi:hypothetical protein [Bradyrhizobium sp. JYMT SZCCT0180]|uniref:hypothetical protein n=1 Tax=Bradyrhizobium sp. JYMT SZCCT0180 TaxID=2807666 RepID=UPI001BA495EB|nr:hypothetical protein [Bradyrhizobium sp. JYMT SZCCT0180]MBR1209737.1 hypothetical protein [Bradyrhizobium sp. JYMT SZCCT0180]
MDDDALELPTMEVRGWIAGAARQCGYRAELADGLGYCAWWLENRNMSGVLRAVSYLLAIHGRRYSDLQPQTRDEGVVCLCPITCGTLIATRALENASEFSEWTGGISTVDPVLMTPIIAQFLDYKFDVCLRYNGLDLVFSEHGVTVFSKSLAGMHLINAETGVDTAIRLVEANRSDVPPTHPYKRNDTLRVPKFRYLEGGGFRFDANMNVLHELDALVTWQGGFDYYFAHQEEPDVWDQAQRNLRMIGLSDAAELFGIARDLFLKDAMADETEVASRYLSEMRKLNALWRDYVPALHRALANWRSARGLEEFGLKGW